MWLFSLWMGQANAWVWVGTPDVSIVVDRPAHDLVSGSTYLTKLRMHACAGGYTDFAVNAWIDPTEPYTRSITAGDWCGVTAFWGDVVEVSSSAFTVVYDEPKTAVEHDGPGTRSVALTPFEVTSGTFGGLAPRLYVTIE